MQKVTLFYPANGSRQFATVYFGERTAKLEGTVRFDNDTFYNYFLTGMDTFHHFNVAFSGPVIFRTYHQSLTLDFPIVAFDEQEFETGKDNITTKFTATPHAWHDRELSTHGPGAEHRNRATPAKSISQSPAPNDADPTPSTTAISAAIPAKRAPARRLSGVQPWPQQKLHIVAQKT